MISVFQGGLGFIEGPAWTRSGHLVVASISKGCVFQLDGSGRVVARHETGGGPNGLACSAAGLYVAQNGGIFGASGSTPGGVQRIAGNQVELLFAEGATAPNDLCFGPDGRLYVSDPLTDKALTEPVEGRVLACDLHTGAWEVAVASRLFPNGVAFDASGQRFYLALTYLRAIERFGFHAGTLTSEGTLCETVNGRPDGMAVDLEGKLWVCTPGTGGIEVFTAEGRFVKRIEIGEGSMTTNCCFGGADMRDLFITASARGQVLTMRVDVPGLPLYPFR
ncbi:MAG: SMP-30/gluconolactonase/LRE family protein [Pseudomonadota bacterium]